MKADEETAYWSWVAADYDRIQANVYGDLDTEACLGQLKAVIDHAQHSILDLGCGVGRLAGTLSDHYPKLRIVGVDSSPVMVDTARLAWPNLEAYVNDGRTLPFEDKSFDAAYSMTMFQHIPYDAQQRYIEEVARVLKPRGVFRFQFVFEGETGPLSFPTPVKTILSFVDQAGLRDTAVDIGTLKWEWCWITAVKP